MQPDINRARTVARQIKMHHPIEMGLGNIINKTPQQTFIIYLEKMFSGTIAFDKIETAKVLSAIDVGAIAKFSNNSKINIHVKLKNPYEDFGRVVSQNKMRWRNYADICTCFTKYANPIITTDEGFDFFKRTLIYYIEQQKTQEVAHLTSLIASTEKNCKNNDENLRYVQLLDEGCEYLKHIDEVYTIVGNGIARVDYEKRMEITDGWVQILTNYFCAGQIYRTDSREGIISLVELDEILKKLNQNTLYLAEQGYSNFRLNILELVFYSLSLTCSSDTSEPQPLKLKQLALFSVERVFGIDSVENWYNESLSVKNIEATNYLMMQQELKPLKKEIENLRIISDKKLLEREVGQNLEKTGDNRHFKI